MGAKPRRANPSGGVSGVPPQMAPPNLGSTLPLVALGATPQGANPEGQTLRGVFPEQSSPRWPPLVSGLLGFARSIPGRIVTGFHRFIWTFLGDLFLVISRVCIHSRLLVYMTTVFFSEIVLRRNCLINRVVLFEEKSILVFPECLEAC